MRGLTELYHEVSNFHHNMLLSSNKFDGVPRRCNKIRTRETIPWLPERLSLSAMVYLQQGARADGRKSVFVPDVATDIPTSFTADVPGFSPPPPVNVRRPPRHAGSRFLDFGSVRFRGTHSLSFDNERRQKMAVHSLPNKSIRCRS